MTRLVTRGPQDFIPIVSGQGGRIVRHDSYSDSRMARHTDLGRRQGRGQHVGALRVTEHVQEDARLAGIELAVSVQVAPREECVKAACRDGVQAIEEGRGFRQLHAVRRRVPALVECGTQGKVSMTLSPNDNQASTLQWTWCLRYMPGNGACRPMMQARQWSKRHLLSSRTTQRGLNSPLSVEWTSWTQYWTQLCTEVSYLPQGRVLPKL